MPATSLIIGANRGIGLQLARQLTARGDTVIAACRTDADNQLANLAAKVVTGVDVATAVGIARLTAALADTEINLLIHNAGILTRESFDELDENAFARMTKQFQVNTLGPLRVVRALSGNLTTGAKVGILSSRVGSMDDNSSGGMYGYRASKAAVNMVGVNLAHDLRARDIAVMLLHPGLVATEMTGGRGIEPLVAARGLIARLDELTMETSGSFWHAEGEQLPW